MTTDAATAICKANEASRFDITHAGTHETHELLRIHKIPTPPEKNWTAHVDAVILVHADFKRLGFDAAGFFVTPPDFHEGGTTPKNAPGPQELQGIGRAFRLSWKPPALQESRNLSGYVEAVYERIWIEE